MDDRDASRSSTSNKKGAASETILIWSFSAADICGNEKLIPDCYAMQCRAQQKNENNISKYDDVCVATQGKLYFLAPYYFIL